MFIGIDFTIFHVKSPISIRQKTLREIGGGRVWRISPSEFRNTL